MTGRLAPGKVVRETGERSTGRPSELPTWLLGSPCSWPWDSGQLGSRAGFKDAWWEFSSLFPASAVAPSFSGGAWPLKSLGGGHGSPSMAAPSAHSGDPPPGLSTHELALASTFLGKVQFPSQPFCFPRTCGSRA